MKTKNANHEHVATLDICGDILKVRWTGNVWRTPCNGSEHSSAVAAMRSELETYLRECGQDPEDSEDEVEALLEGIQL